MTEIRLVKYGSPEYFATVELRREVLRKPLGLEFNQDQLDAESGDYHWALLLAGEPLACLILTPIGAGNLKMRQVAVRPDLQGQGLGRQLVAASEVWALGQRFGRMELHARDTAVPFYLSLGYSLEGEPFEEVGIPHRAMFKDLES